MIRKAAQHEANAAFLQAGRQSRDSLIEKMVVPQVSVRIEGYRSKKDDARLSECICRLHSDLKSWIIERTLRALHPVDNAFAFWSGGSARRTVTRAFETRR